MRIVIINTDYPPFLADHYAAHPGLANAAYARQITARNESYFGVANYYSQAFRQAGHQAWELHANNPSLQLAWAKEHGLKVVSPPQRVDPLRKLWRAALATPLGPMLSSLRKPAPVRPALPEHLMGILLAQIEELRPDVVLNQALDGVGSHQMRQVKDLARLLAGQIAAPLPVGEDFGMYRLMFSSLPNQVAWFRQRGVAAHLVRLAFEPRVLDALGKVEPEVEVSFVGSLSANHPGRTELMERLCTSVGLKVWGMLPPGLPRKSPLRSAWQGRAWGLEMYRVLARSRITLNRHIAIAGPHANNLRLYEATGVGSCLLTDGQQDLAEMFEPGRQVLAYGDANECEQMIRNYLGDEPARAAIARAGQERTLREHSFSDRVQKMLALFEDRL